MWLTAAFVGLMLGVEPGAGDPPLSALDPSGPPGLAASAWQAGPPAPAYPVRRRRVAVSAAAFAGPGRTGDLQSRRPARRSALGIETIEPEVQSTWYTRVDYFYWNEMFDGADNSSTSRAC